MFDIIKNKISIHYIKKATKVMDKEPNLIGMRKSLDYLELAFKYAPNNIRGIMNEALLNGILDETKNIIKSNKIES